jgi:hypothetical protein
MYSHALRATSTGVYSHALRATSTGVYSHALRATSTGIAQSREARPYSGAERLEDRA